ncbi:MAG: OsmC family protein [Promethearchaeota archaeon]
MELDEPESFHGTNLGPSAIEYLLTSIGGCLGTSFVYCLQKKRVKIEDLSLEIEGIMKHGNEDIHLRLIQVNVDIQYKISEQYSQELEACLKTFQEYCVLTNTIIMGIPISVNYIDKKNK